jgi:hypothetical protein
MAVDAGGRADIDDRSPAAGADRGRRRLHAEERPGQVDRQHPLPVGARGADQVDAAQRYAGIVHQHVQGAESGFSE